RAAPSAANRHVPIMCRLLPAPCRLAAPRLSPSFLHASIACGGLPLASTGKPTNVASRRDVARRIRRGEDDETGDFIAAAHASAGFAPARKRFILDIGSKCLARAPLIVPGARAGEARAVRRDRTRISAWNPPRSSHSRMSAWRL